VVADEPTAPLDATTEKQVLELLDRLRRRFGIAFLFISHDPLVLAEMADRILVLYAGRRAEEGPRDAVLRQPLHPYTEGCSPACQVRVVIHRDIAHAVFVMTHPDDLPQSVPVPLPLGSSQQLIDTVPHEL
jgi:ABC-type dipeptide/oligopeptide/nickel transport system ATPase component